MSSGKSLKRPRILITRTRQQASVLAQQLQALNADTIVIPTIEVVEPASFESLDLAIAALSDPTNPFSYLVFTSANAASALAGRARQQGVTLYPWRIAAIGPATAKAVEKEELVPQIAPVLLPPYYVAESLAAALIENAASPAENFLLIRAEQARDVLPSALEAAGHRVTIATAYRNLTPPETLPALRNLFSTKSEWPAAITFTSSSTARNLVTLLESIGQTIPPGIALASIGPVTSATLRELGYEPTFEAEEPTIDSLVLTIAKHLNLT